MEKNQQQQRIQTPECSIDALNLTIMTRVKLKYLSSVISMIKIVAFFLLLLAIRREFEKRDECREKVTDLRDKADDCEERSSLAKSLRSLIMST